MTTIITRNNPTAGEQPEGGTVSAGELCVNTGDGTLWTSSDGGNIVPVGGSGGSGDLPVGTSDGQMLKWTATGSPTWSVTDVINVTTDNNIAIGGPQYSSAYKLTVTGNTALGGDLLVQDIIGGEASLESLAVNSDPATGNEVARKSYLDATYAAKGGTVTLTGTQAVSGTKNFQTISWVTATANQISCTFSTLGNPTLTGSCNINSLATLGGSAWFVMANDGGLMKKGGLVAGAALVQSVLTQFAIAMDATPAQMAAVTSAIAPLTVV